MKRIPTLFVALGIAAATLSSCSRSNYAFNATTPAYLGLEKIKVAAPTAEAETKPIATETAGALSDKPLIFTHVAKKLIKHTVKTAIIAPLVAAKMPVTDAVTSTIAKTSYTHAEHKAVRHQVKQIIASHNSTTAEGKSQLVAVLLCFFLGGLGIHDFYMGKVGKGILQIFLSLIIVGFILVIIDFVRLLTGDLKPKDGDWAKKL
jgi:TM2 domain-containing membrane protein YozV